MFALVSFIIVIGVCVVSHEFGHFISARLLGVQVHEFAFGMGPAIYRKRKGETLWSIRAFPIGGFVRLAGMGEAVEGEVEDPERSFSAKSPARRWLILAAGSIINILLAIVIATLFLWGHGVLDMEHARIGELMPGYPAESIGLLPGDTITSINDKKVTTWLEMATTLKSNADNPVTIEVERPEVGRLVFRNVLLKPDPVTGAYILGIKPGQIKYEGLSAIQYSLKYLWEMTKNIFSALVNWALGGQKIDVTGPVGIAEMAGEAAKSGVWTFLFFLGIINLNLGLFNLIPFPALDGGRLLFVTIEMIFRKKVPEYIEQKVHFIGMMVLLALIALITWQDITRIFSR